MAEKRTVGTKEEEKPMKIFNDPVHGHIEMPSLLVDIINTPEFQRLRNIKQLGGGYYVFPGASHNRFEHSIGVAHLAGQLVKSLREHQNLKISREDELCVQIAGLCHDLGHGPFSHLFQVFMNERDRNWEHEKQSVEMFKYLIKEHEIDKEMKDKGLSADLIADLIHPKGKKIPQDKAYLYQIVANSKTGIDVDKMDYFVRDCHHLGMKCNFSYERYMKFARVYDVNGEKQICMRDKEAINMYELFHIRSLLHHTAYQHRVTKAVELMILDALKAADKTLKISAKPLPDYVNLTDGILLEILQHPEGKEQKKTELTRAKTIIRRIFHRDYYKFIGGKIFEPIEVKHMENTEKKEKKLEAWLGKFQQTANEKNLHLSTDDFEVVIIKLNYGMKDKNPIDALQFYTKNPSDKPKPLSKEKVSYLLPQKFAETKLMIFYKGKDGEVEELAQEHIDLFWTDVVQDPFAAVDDPNTHIQLSDGVVKEILRSSTLQLQIKEETREKFSKHGFCLVGDKIFERQKLNHLDTDTKWQEKLNAWLKNDKQAGGQQPALTAGDFKVVSYLQPGESDLIQVMLFHKGKAKVDARNFWEEVQKVPKRKNADKQTEKETLKVAKLDSQK